MGASHPVEYFEARVDPGMLICPAPLYFHAEAIHLLAFFPQDREDIHCRTAGYRQQEQAMGLGASTRVTDADSIS